MKSGLPGNNYPTFGNYVNHIVLTLLKAGIVGYLYQLYSLKAHLYQPHSLVLIFTKNSYVPQLLAQGLCVVPNQDYSPHFPKGLE